MHTSPSFSHYQPRIHLISSLLVTHLIFFFLRPTPGIILPVKISVFVCDRLQNMTINSFLIICNSFPCNVIRLVLPSRGGYLFHDPLGLGWSGDFHCSTECQRSDALSLPNWRFKELESFCFYSPGILLPRDCQIIKYTEHISNNPGHVFS